MSDFASVVERTRKAFASVSRLEEALFRSPEDRSLQVNLAAMRKAANQSQDQLFRLSEYRHVEVYNEDQMDPTIYDVPTSKDRDLAAADDIIHKLSAALKPFANAAKEYDSRVYPLDSGRQSIGIPLSDCRKALEALRLVGQR